MKTIMLTIVNGTKVSLNVELIGHIYADPGEGCTKVGILTHNNGGFKVKESHLEILELIKKVTTP